MAQARELVAGSRRNWQALRSRSSRRGFMWWNAGRWPKPAPASAVVGRIQTNAHNAPAGARGSGGMMMGSATTLRPRQPAGCAPPTPGDSMRADGPGFLSMLAAAGRTRQEVALPPKSHSCLQRRRIPRASQPCWPRCSRAAGAPAQNSGGNAQAEGGDAGRTESPGVSSLDALLLESAPAPDQARGALDRKPSVHSLPRRSTRSPRARVPRRTSCRNDQELASAMREGMPDLRAAPEPRTSGAPEFRPASTWRTVPRPRRRHLPLPDCKRRRSGSCVRRWVRRAGLRNSDRAR